MVFVALSLAYNLRAQDQNVARAVHAAPEHHHHTIVVTGAAEISAAPDQAAVRFGMTAQNSRAGVAQSKVNDVIQKAIDAIQKVGVKRQSIHTASITLTPIYSDKLLSSGGSKISAFRADNVIEVTVDDLKLIGEVIDAAINAGANEIQGVYFRLKDDRAQHHNALALATQEAKSKAETIAKSLSVALGSPIDVVETSGRSPITLQSVEPSFQGLVASKSMAPTRIEPGQIRIESTVVVRYEIGVSSNK